MGVDQAFFDLTTGIWRCNPSVKINHAITVVGWGQENGENYWMIKNSWGTSWGDNGFGRISMDHCTLGSSYGVIMKCPEAKQEEREWDVVGNALGCNPSGCIEVDTNQGCLADAHEWNQCYWNTLEEAKARCGAWGACKAFWGPYNGKYYARGEGFFQWTA